MAYCVRCGVKLSEGLKSCPLCDTKVMLPEGMTEQTSTPLFSQSLPVQGSKGLSKTKKGFIELILSLFFISEVSVFLSMWLSGAIEHSFVPLFSIAMATLCLIFVVLGHQSYPKQASIQALLVMVYLIGLDLQNAVLSWSLIAVPSIALYLALLVLPFSPWAKRFLKSTVVIMILSLFLYLLLLNVVIAGSLTWFFPVAFFQVLIMCSFTALLLVWLSRRKNKKIPIADVVFGSLFVLFMSAVAFDILLAHYQSGSFAIHWSRSLLAASVVIFLFLTGVSLSRRLRRFFTSHNLHT